VRLAVSAVEQVALEEATEVLGPSDALVAACSMPVTGALSGQILLVFDDRAGLALVDLLLHQPLGTTTTWGELEQSAAAETTNIVGCAYLNSLAAHLPALDTTGPATIVPGPPMFRHEVAGSLLEFTLMDQATVSDRLLLVDTQFLVEETRLDWTLLFVPGGSSLQALMAALW
jgi:chemotaxis protein CheC